MVKSFARSVPNFLTCLRIAMTGILVFVPVPGAVFGALYLVCGLTDIMDGFLARRFNAESAFGARLDSAADFLFVCVMLFRLWAILSPNTVLLLWVAGIASLRIAAAIIAGVRFGKYGFLHTWANKATGFLLFFYPLTLMISYLPIVAYSLCLIASASAIEELVIEITAEKWEPDRRSFFIRG